MNRLSTYGCKLKWKQRAPRGNKRPGDHDSDVDDDDENLIGNVLKEMSGHIPKQCVDVYRARPNDEGVVHRTTKTRKRTRTHNPDIKFFPAPGQGDYNQLSYDDHNHREGDCELKDVIADFLSSGDFIEEPSEWTTRRQHAELNWEEYRLTIMACMLESHAVPENRTCFKCNETATVHCHDCMGALLCKMCDEDVHVLQPFHNRESWTDDGFFKPLPQEYYFPSNKHFSIGTCQFCPNKAFESVDGGSFIAITLKGRFDVPKKKTVCTSCKKAVIGIDLVNLLHMGFWPGDPAMQSTYIFEQKLLELWLSVSMHLPGSSLSGFLNALGDIGTKYGRKRYIDHTMFSRAVAEFGYMQDELLQIKQQDNMKCPPCTISQIMCHIDGNHKVYRYQHVDSGTAKPYYTGRFVAPDKDVKQHAEHVYSLHPRKGSPGNMYCGPTRWKAAKESTSKKASLDETGLVVAGCRHAIAQKAVNMFAGELYAYAHYIHINFVVPNHVQFLFQDIICKYWPWAKTVARANPHWNTSVVAVRPALSVMHAKAHSWQCQIKWSGRYVDGAGTCLGEEMEQFFSHLSRTGNTTKYMGAAARIDTITNHVLFWNRRKIQALPELLCKRYKKMKLDMCDTENELQNLTGMGHSAGREELLKEWKREILKTAEDSKKGSRKTDSTKFILNQKLKEANMLQEFLNCTSNGLSEMTASNDLYRLASARCGETAALKEKLEKLGPCGDDGRHEAVISTMDNLKKTIEINVANYQQRNLAFSRLAGNSKQAAKIKSKMERMKAKISNMLSQLQHVQLVGNQYAADDYNIQDIVRGKFPWHVTASTDWTVKKKATDAYMMQQRLNEEELIINTEMKNLLIFYNQVYRTLKNEMKELVVQQLTENCDDDLPSMAEDAEPCYRYKITGKDMSPSIIKGLQSIKYCGLQEAQTNINKALTYFKKFVTEGGWETIILDFMEEEEVEEEEEEEDFDEADFAL